MMKQILSFMFILCFICQIESETSIFDKCEWKEHLLEDNIELYWNTSSYPCFYKAETTINDSYYDDVLNTLLDFGNYKKIFPGTEKFDVLEKQGNSFLIHCILNFFPLKNREYVICLKYFEQENNPSMLIEWNSVDNALARKFLNNKKYKLIKSVNGRWKIFKTSENKIMISLEYYNDWEIEADNDLMILLEKKSTITSMKNLLRYIGIE